MQIRITMIAVDQAKILPAYSFILSKKLRNFLIEKAVLMLWFIFLNIHKCIKE